MSLPAPELSYAALVLIGRAQSKGFIQGPFKANADRAHVLWVDAGRLGDRHAWVERAVEIMGYVGPIGNDGLENAGLDEEAIIPMKVLLYAEADELEAEQLRAVADGG